MGVRPATLAAALCVLLVSAAVAAGQGADTLTEYRLPPDTLDKAEALYRTGMAMFVVGKVYGLALLVLILAGRVAPRFRDIAERARLRGFVQAMVFVPLLSLTMDGLSLPLSL